ncbi:hypothetical protein [Streptomyces pharetrae]|uniref:hypothetical protein n=1 Tax=Streptomyces pharetrae TaxID=291370 RepID=UPI00118033AA
MPTVTEKSIYLYGCRLGPTSIRQLARIASEGIENATVTFSHTHDSTKFTADNLDELLDLISNSSVVTDMANCTNLTVSVHGQNFHSFFMLRPEHVYVLLRGPDREAVLGKFETVVGYLKGHGGVSTEIGPALRPFYYLIGLGVTLQFLIYGIGRWKLQYSIAGSVICFICYGIAMRTKREIMNRRMSVINALNEPQPTLRGWSGLSAGNKIAAIVAALTAVAAGAAVASAAADWIK